MDHKNMGVEFSQNAGYSIETSLRKQGLNLRFYNPPYSPHCIRMAHPEANGRLFNPLQAHLLIFGGAAGVGKSTIGKMIATHCPGTLRVSSGDLLCKAAKIQPHERAAFYESDFRRHEPVAMNLLSQKINTLCPGQVMIYDSRYAVTSPGIRESGEFWVPAMSEQYLISVINRAGLSVHLILFETSTIDVLVKRRLGDTEKRRPDDIKEILEEIEQSRTQFGRYIQVVTKALGFDVVSGAFVVVPEGQEHTIIVSEFLTKPFSYEPLEI